MKKQIQELNAECTRLINLAFGPSDWVDPEDFHYGAIMMAQRIQHYHANEPFYLDQAIDVLKVSLTAAAVASSSGCVPVSKKSIGRNPDRYRVVMACFDEDLFRDAVYCVRPIDTGSYGYNVTGLFKEFGEYIAILEKAAVLAAPTVVSDDDVELPDWCKRFDERDVTTVGQPSVYLDLLDGSFGPAGPDDDSAIGYVDVECPACNKWTYCEAEWLEDEKESKALCGATDPAGPAGQHDASVPAHIAKARAMRADGATMQGIVSETIKDFTIGMARQKFGTEFKTARLVAKSLERLSKLAKAGQYDKLIEDSNFQDLWDWYENAYNAVGDFYMGVLAPNALAYNEFVDMCDSATVSATISPLCPACQRASLEIDPDFIIDRPTKQMVSIVCKCPHCGFMPTLDIEIVKPKSEKTSLVRSYIRSLLVFEEYRPDCGPIIDNRMAERVSAQAYKAMAHLPNGLVYDYDKIVREEMAAMSA